MKPLIFDSYHLVKSYLNQFPPEISEQTFTNLFVWRKARPVFYTEINETLVFLIGDTTDSLTKLLLGPPVGKATLNDILNFLKGQVSGAIRIPKSNLKKESAENLFIKEDPDNFDYVYRTAELANLSGRRFAKKRNLIKQCLKNHLCDYEPITIENLEECAKMQTRWCDYRQCSRSPGLCNEFSAITELFTNYDKFDLFGGAIRVNGSIAAFSIGERLNTNTAVCHFEKSMPNFIGLGQLINQWFAKYSLDGFDYVNREQDLGIPGLRQAKLSYYPDHMVEKITVRVKDYSHENHALKEICMK